MLKTVSWSDYEESGCVNCGCDFTYNSRGVSGGGVTPARCGECGEDFFILADGLEKSTMGFGTNQKNEKGETIFEHPTLQEHPRKGTPKHKFVRPDIRPENGIGDFCSPRSIGYDLACFVKSKEAGQRITDMINKVNEEYDGKGFSCWLDYREHEPLWIQVKIKYPDELRGTILSQLISENDCVITETQIREAMDMKINFENYWKYEASGYADNAVQLPFMHAIAAKPEDITAAKREEAYQETFQRNNHLDQFEAWGAYKQIELEVEKGNIRNAVALAEHLIALNSDHFNHELMIQRAKERGYITSIRDSFHKQLVKVVTIYYKDMKRSKKIVNDKDFTYYFSLRDNAKISKDMESEFLSDWQEIVPMIFKAVDIEALKLSTDWESEKSFEDKQKESKLLSKYTNLYSMFSVFGLYAYVSRQLEQNNYENAALAIKHIADQMNSPLFLRLKKQTKKDDINAAAIGNVYLKADDMANKYYGDKTIVAESDMPVKKLKPKNN